MLLCSTQGGAAWPLSPEEGSGGELKDQDHSQAKESCLGSASQTPGEAQPGRTAKKTCDCVRLGFSLFPSLMSPDSGRS